MACHEIVEDGKVVGHICRQSGTTAPVPNRRRKRWWCFKCRQRFLHTLMMFDPGPMSYYGPSFWWECPKCHEENVLFPGTSWVYEE
jgi:hypothetical protein